MLRVFLAALFAATMTTAFTAPVSAEEKPMRPGCGWIVENNKQIFLGTCPDTTSDDADAPPEPSVV